MYDYQITHTYIIHQPSFLNNELEFRNQVNTKTGELYENILVSKDKNLKFRIYSNEFLKINGSFHSYFNNGEHNWNDFTIPQFNQVLRSIESNYNIDFNKCYLRTIEFGVNVTLPFKVEKFLNAILSYKGAKLGREYFKGNGNMVRFNFGQYEVKIYDKGQQFDLHENVLRFELKVKRMRYLSRRGIYLMNPNDLTDINNITALQKLILNTFNELLVYDDLMQINSLSDYEQRLLIEGKNPQFWIDCKNASKENFKKKRQRFRQLIADNVEVTMQNQVKELIESKLKQLIE